MRILIFHIGNDLNNPTTNTNRDENAEKWCKKNTTIQRDFSSSYKSIFTFIIFKKVKRFIW
jgi:hypothetical protein